MTRNLVNDPEHWRHRAEEMRRSADDMQDPQAQDTMRRIATDYDRLAERAEERQSGTRPAGPGKPAF